MQTKDSTLTIRRFLGDDHAHCDSLFAAAEDAVSQTEWPAAALAFEGFSMALLHHLSMEEALLFPAFERATGNDYGPTRIMRLEHRQMRDLLGELAQAVAARSADDYRGLAETLLMLIQQHNVKEEQVLYPICDQVLGGEMVSRLRDFSAPGN